MDDHAVIAVKFRLREGVLTEEQLGEAAHRVHEAASHAYKEYLEEVLGTSLEQREGS